MRYLPLLLLWALAVSAQEPKPQTLPGKLSTVEGSVLNSITGDPVGRVYLLLMRTGSSEQSEDLSRSYGTSSDSAGRFVIRNIEPGRYRLRASRNGYLTVEYGARRLQGAGAVLDLAEAQHLKNIDIRLTQHGVIAGRILDIDGEPLAGAQVQLLRPRYINGKKVASTIRTTYTNDIGEYRWPGLEPGKYYMYADGRGERPLAANSEEDFVPTYYPGALDATAAVPIDMAPGSEIRAADIVLLKARTVSVKGSVVIVSPRRRTGYPIRSVQSALRPQ